MGRALSSPPKTGRTGSSSSRGLRIGGEDILLKLLLEGDGIAARVLKRLGVQIEKTREAILTESALYGHQS